MKTIAPDNKNIAACGLYCGACRKFLAEKCSGCKPNKKQLGVKSAHVAKKTSLILVLNAPMMSGNASCFPIDKQSICILFNSDRSACISYIKEQGEQAFAEEMTKRKCQTIRRK